MTDKTALADTRSQSVAGNSMKYPQLVSMPSAVSDWLEEQLEARGIDAVVYTRYVLSLLHRDTNDLICPDHEVNVPKVSLPRLHDSVL